MREAYPYGMWLSTDFLGASLAKSKWYNWRYQTILFHMSENEQEIKELLVQLELDLISRVDDSLVLGPNQYSTRERTFRGGTILNETEFKILPPDVIDLLHSARRDQIIPEHERMRFDEPLASVQDEYALTDTQRHDYQNTVVGKGSGEIVEIDWSENNYSPNQLFTNEQIDYLALQDKTFVGGTIANEINLDGLQLALNQCEITYLQELDCVVDIGKAVVADLELEIKNQVFSAELINKVNKEREWSGGIIVPETDFSEDDEFDGHDDGNVVFSV